MPVYSVSVTGTKTSILNISVDKIVAECIIQADELPGKDSVENTQMESEENTEKTTTKKEEQQRSALAKVLLTARIFCFWMNRQKELMRNLK